jgi:putative nucleotidyltransferase with HDIG domain
VTEALASQALSDLQDALRAGSLYPRSHPAIAERALRLWESLSRLLGSAVEIHAAGETLACGDLRLSDTERRWRNLFASLRTLGIETLGFEPGLRLEDVRAVVTTLGRFLTGRGEGLAEAWKDAQIEYARYRGSAEHETLGRRALRIRKGSIAAMGALAEALRKERVPSTPPLLGAIEALQGLAFEHPRTALSLAMLGDEPDYSGTHATNVAVLALLYGRQLGLASEELARFGLGALLHDIGEMRTPAAIRQNPGALTVEELRLVELHPELGAEILQGMPRIHPDTRAIVLQHHVRIDGTGYPALPSGTELHPLAEAVGILECYEALTSNRPYQRPHSPSEAIALLKEMAGRSYSRGLVQRVVEMLGPFPVGEALRLASGEIAVAVGSGSGDGQDLVLRIVVDRSGNRPSPPIRLALRPGDARLVVAPVDPLTKGIDVARVLESELLG